MSKKTTKALASATLMSLVLTTALTAGPVKAAAGSVTRTGGADRYETAAKVATTNWTSAENVILVNGLSYADSVSASVLAKKLNAPILLTEADSLNSNAKSALEKLSPKNVYIVGGTGAVSQSVESSLSSYKVTRLAGTNRYDTNLAVANKLVDLGVSKDNMLAVTGQAYSDALSAAPVAAAKDQILLLTTNDKTSMKATDEFAKDANVTVIGTTNSVDADTYSNLAADKRIDGGKDRFATNINILKAFDSDLKATSLYAATGKANADGAKDTAFADALVASAIAGKNSAPLVLLDSDSSDATSNALNYIGTKATKSTDLQVVGGTGVVSDSLVSKINDKVNPQSDDNAEVSSISTVGLNQIKVVFSGEVDEDTAEDLNYYEVDGDSIKGSANLQDDNKTVLITLSEKHKQNDSVDVKVKKGVLSKDKSSTVLELTQSVTFEDTTAPTVDSVSVRGNNKLDIKFSEPVKGNSSLADDATDDAVFKDALKNIVSKLKINDKNLSSFGINYEETDGKGNTLSKLDNAVRDSKNKSIVYTDEIELYFDDELSTGDNTLKLSNANDDTLSDAAGFPIDDVTENFTVDTLTSDPKINSITAEDSGKVYINFDRPMDARTATKVANYQVNNESISGATVELKKDDTQVKISGVSGLNKNSNKLYISDDVKDAYGNKVKDDTYEAFNLDEDTTKPTVESVTALNDDTIRVVFSKDVSTKYATNKSNYKLKDNDGTDITDEYIDDIQKSGGKNTDTTGDVFDINLNSGKKLSDSKYTLTIKNIQDVASTPNIMDDKDITFDGSSDVNGEVTGAYVPSDNNKKIVVVFNKAMDSSSLGDTDNYEYVNGSGDTKPLPSDADITVSSNDKSVTIDLEDTSLKAIGDLAKGDNEIKSIYATGVKDDDGNSLSTGNNGKVITSGTLGTSLKQNSVRFSYNGDDLKVQATFTEPLDDDSDANTNVENYTVAGVHPDRVAVDSDKVTLTFDSNNDAEDSAYGTSAATKINKVKHAGNKAKLTMNDLVDVTGGSVTDSANPYFYDAAPRLIIAKDNEDFSSIWETYTNATDGTDVKTNEVGIGVQFDTPINGNSVNASDFAFNVGGATVDATNAVVKSDDNSTVIFKFSGSDLKDLSSAIAKATKEVGKTDGTVRIKVTPKTSSKISTVKDSADNNAYYVPTDDDTKTIYVSMLPSDVTKAVDVSSLDDAKSKVESSYDLAKGTEDTDEAKEAAVKDEVVSAIDNADITVKVTPDETNTGKYVVTLTKGDANATVDNITVTIAE